VVARPDGDMIWIACAFERDGIGPVLPKGGRKKRESLEEAARREIAEETGLTDLHYLGELGSRERQDWRRRFWQVTHYLLFGTLQTVGTPTDPKHPPSRWAELGPELPLIWPEQVDLLRAQSALIRRLVGEWQAGQGSAPTDSERDRLS
jgi:8-oxo-dGTP pyrophosphatase MutT (NUDIX family)